MSWKNLLTTMVCFTACASLHSTPDQDLQAAIIAANAGSTTINFTVPVTLTNSFGQPLLRPLNSDVTFSPISQTITINGNNNSLNGNNAFRGFFVRGGTVVINNLTFTQTAATGGSGGVGATSDGGGAGGGGAGLGGALYVCSGATVTLNTTAFSNSTATGGIGGALSLSSLNSGGGGGLTGAGGPGGGAGGAGGGGGLAYTGGGPVISGGAGAGGGGCGSAGATPTTTTGGNGGGNFALAGGGAGGPANSNGSPGASGAGGGGGGDTATGANASTGGAGMAGGGGGGGGTNEANSNSPNGGNGGLYAGGGGGGTDNLTPPFNAVGGHGGSGSFGGGGGGGGLGESSPGFNATGGTGGQGGYGGGGGGGGQAITTATATPGAGGISNPVTTLFPSGLGGSGAAASALHPGAGGGGAGLGGAIFIENGGVLNIQGSVSFGSNLATGGAPGGAGATAGTALGQDIFMQNGSTLNFSLTSPLILSNPIQSENNANSGGGVNVGGSASVTFSGLANTYTGTTTISSDGTLVISSDGNLGTGGSAASNPLVMNSTAGNPTLEIAGAVTLAPARGNVTFTGSGTSTFLIDSGDSLTYAGTVALGTGSLTVNTGTGSSGTLSGIISGTTGNLTASGVGTLFLSGAAANTFSGTTMVNGGTVDLQKTAGIVALSGTVIVNSGGTLTQVHSGQFATTTDLTLSGGALGAFNMGGFATTLDSFTFNSGTFNQGAALTLTSTGTSPAALTQQTGTTIPGPLVFSPGASVVLTGASGTALINGTIDLGGGNVDFNMGGSAGPVMQVAGAISNGSLTVTGSGLLDLTGANTYVGATTVQSGTLAVNGSITSNTTVSLGGTLRGSGMITGNVDVFGTMWPGNSVGTMTITGTYEQHPGSTLINEITPTLTDLVTAGGNVTIDPGATFALMPDMGMYTAGTIYEVIQSTGGTVTGTFSNFTNSFPAVRGHLFYTNTGVFFEVDQAGLVLMVTTGNAGKVAAALDAVVASGNSTLNPLIMTLLPLSQSQLVNALNQLQPSLYKGMAVVQENNVVKVHDALGYRFQNILDEKECCIQPEDDTMYVWLDGLGDFSNQKNTHYASSPQVGYGSSTAGVVGGFDFNFQDNFYIGALGAYTHSNIRYKNHQGHGEINSGYAGLYASAIGDILYGNAALIGSWNRYDARRNIIYPGLNATASNKHNGTQLLTHLDTGLNFNVWELTMRPFDSFDYITQKEHSFKEHGGGLTDLSVLGKMFQMIRNELGLNFAKCFSVEQDTWVVDAKFSWVREVRLKGKSSTSRFIGTAVDFTTIGYFTNRSLFSPGLSVTYVTLNDLLDVMVYYNGEFGSKYNDQSVGLEVGFQF